MTPKRPRPPRAAAWSQPAWLLGSTRLQHGDVDGAEALLDEAIAAFDEAGAPDVAARAMLMRGITRALHGDLVGAKAATAEARQRSAAGGVRIGIAACAIQTAALAALDGDLALADDEAATAEAILHGLPRHALHGELEAARALIARQRGDPAPARHVAASSHAARSVMAGLLLRRSP